jgi:hypothetical protein
MTLYSITKGNVADDLIFSIADQIKHGIGNLADENPELRINFAKLNELAGMQAVDRSDHATSRSYLTNALSFLPTDHWKSQYDLSLRFSLRLAKSCYACGDLEKAQCILQEMTEQCQRTEDKLPGYALLARSESHHRWSRFLRQGFTGLYFADNFICHSSFRSQQFLGSIYPFARGIIPIRRGNTRIIASISTSVNG